MFASAGNTAQRHWCGMFAPNEDGWHQWQDDAAINTLTPWGKDRVAVEFYGPTQSSFEVSIWKHATGELWNPDFVKLAEAMGANGYLVEQPGDLAGTFQAALASGRPSVVEVRINRDTAVPLIGTWKFPPITQAEPTFGKRKLITS